MADPRTPDEDTPDPKSTAAGAPKPEPEPDPFATFTEWASDADTAGYANL